MLRSAVAIVISLFPWSGVLRAAITAHDTAALLAAGSFDVHECYRVHDLEIDKEDLRIFLTSGHLIFATPINGRRPAALFAADVDAGDAEVLVIPPNRSERRSLAAFTDAPNFEEHFGTALMLFTDGTGEELERLIAEKESDAAISWRDEAAGHDMAVNGTPVLRNLYGSLDTRLIQGLLSPPSRGLFFATIIGNKLHNFDVEYDPLPSPRIVLGQLKQRDGRNWFDTWTSFPARSARTAKQDRERPVRMADFRIDAALDNNLRVSAETRAKVVIAPGSERAVPFLIASGMHVDEASIDGRPAEVFESDSLRSTLIRGGPDVTFLVIPPAPLEPGRAYEFRFHHEGDVVSPTDDGAYFVGARGAWYPHEEVEFANFDITYRWPHTLDLVSTGDLVETHDDGDAAVAHYRTAAPIRMAGFNLGKWERRTLDQNGFHIQVCANSTPATALNTRAQRLDEVAREVSAALAFMTERFGPPPVKSLIVSPIPASFGQGFPGLIYLSTLSYLEPSERPRALRDTYTDLLYSDLMLVHETAHQWWGNLVIPETTQDDWLAEALANYSALLFLEQRDGPAVVESVLDGYRKHLTAHGSAEHTVESAGPITWSTRLSSSQNPDAWRIITYEKGSWIMHMLRVRLGAANFSAFLRELCKRYRLASLSTEEFRTTAAQFLPPDSPDPNLEAFFDTWVYGTGIPSLRLSYTVKGSRISGTVTQSGVGGDFSAWVPVHIDIAGSKPAVRWVETGSDPVSFSWSLPGRAVSAALQPGDALVTIQE